MGYIDTNAMGYTMIQSNQTGNETFQNASSSVTDGMASSYDLVPILVVVVAAAVAIALSPPVTRWLGRNRLVSRLADRFERSLDYAVLGLVPTAVIAVLSMLGYAAMQTDPQTRSQAVKAIGVIVVGYCILVALGWLTERSLEAYAAGRDDIDEWTDLLPETPDPEGESTE